MRKKMTHLSPFAIAVIALMLLSTLFLGLRNLLAPASSGTPSISTTSATNVKALIGRVGTHILINQNEQPTVATITDVVLLRRQNPQFYRDAQNGDRLLLWSDKAVLYSPERDILLAVTPINAPIAQANATSSVVADPKTGTEARP